MKQRRQIQLNGMSSLVARSLAIAVMATAVNGCGDDAANEYAPPPPPDVIVATPVEREVTNYFIYTGVVEASETVELRARVPGFLEKIHFQPGQRVNKGDLLFEIDKRQYQAAVEQAEAEIRALEAALRGADNDAKLARELADQKAGPEIDAVIKLAKRDSVEAEVARAKAQLVEAQLNLDFCEIHAPMSGRITANLVDVGNLVGRSEPTLLANIVQATPCYVSVDVSESDVLAVRESARASEQSDQYEPGKIGPNEWRPCELALANQDEFTVPGHVNYVAPNMDNATGTLEVRTVYANEDETLTPGYFAQVRFPMSTYNAMLVPEAALLTDQQGRYALVVNAEDEVEEKRVEIGELDGDMRVVESGLELTDRVIVLGVLKARPGSKVTPVTQEPAAESR